MKRTLIIIVMTMLLAAISVVIAFEIIVQMDQPRADFVETIDSQILGESRELLVHLPVGYNPALSYPVAYVLDGSSQDFRMAHIAEVLSRANVVGEMIIVGIPNTHRNRDLTPPYILRETDGGVYGQGDQFLAFLTDEVVPLVEEKYPANRHRILVGHSRGGLFSYYACLERPHFFEAYFCFSPAFWRDDAIIVERTKAAPQSVDAKIPFVFMSLGTEENDKMKQAYDAMTQVLDGRRHSHVYHTYTTGANHSNNLYYSSPEALREWSEWRSRQP